MMVYPLSPSNEDLSDLQARLGVRFRDEALLVQALTHPSWVAEDALGGHMPPHPSQETLVDLGDPLLWGVVARCRARAYSASLVREPYGARGLYSGRYWPSQHGRELGLDDLLRVGCNEPPSLRSQHDLVDRTMKAVLGALSADDQKEAIERLVSDWITTHPSSFAALWTGRRYKEPIGAVKELYSRRWGTRAPGASERFTGPPHRPIWHLTYDLTRVGLGIYFDSARTKQAATSGAFSSAFCDARQVGLIR